MKSVPQLFVIIFALMLGLGACTSQAEDPNDVAAMFWESVQAKQLDSAKQYVTWDSAKHLNYFTDERMKIASYEFAEPVVKEDVIAIDTIVVLERKDKDNVRLPTKTVLVKTEGVWRVELKQTLAAVLERSADKFANQLNQIFQQGISEIDKALAESVGELSGSLEQGAKELGNALEQNAGDLSNSLKQFQLELEQHRDKK
ncbi:MAG: Unknown protein [uncultured Thiotrichaceae bacterium]|uniref:DUF4878 domain-containing protein n=1 Tax=uncultured Thiotrichaceae bacterium TaxID=298394 RepID=A0A6S6U5T6_9GAMM|nr:MAG: Unknown protein [uncultured Thiotrichaceae bacterium]